MGQTIAAFGPERVHWARERGMVLRKVGGERAMMPMANIQQENIFIEECLKAVLYSSFVVIMIIAVGLILATL